MRLRFIFTGEHERENAPTCLLSTSASGPDLVAILTWDTGNPEAESCLEGGETWGAVDLDLHLIEPDGTRVSFFNRCGPSARLETDNQTAFGPERIIVPAGKALEGIYRLQVVYSCGNNIPTQATLVIRVFAGTIHEQTALFTRCLTTQDDLLATNMAEISFPSGTIQEISGSICLLNLTVSA